jgi:flavin reductase (DIM6/NTAB) family NADH-FMN oxidoreductase RutF
MDSEPQKVVEVLRHIATNVSIVTTRDGDVLHGMTATMWAEAAEPPHVLITLNRQAKTYWHIKRSRVFAVSLLSEKQEDLALRFGAADVPDSELFSSISYRTEVTDSPILDGSIAFFDCRVEGFYPFGSFDIVTGQIEKAGLGPTDKPLVYYASHLASIVPFGLTLQYPPQP